MKVLYIHMIGAFGGASRSLSEAIGAFPPGQVEARFVTASGTVEGVFGALGPVVVARGMTQFDNTRYSYYRGLRWLVLLRELAYLPATIAALYRARAQWPDIDLIHVNEFTGLIPWLVARHLFKVPTVVHVRSVARAGRSWRTRLVSSMLARHAEAVVAIDDTVRASLPSSLPVTVIHNAFSPKNVPADAPPLAWPKLRAGSFKVGFVGNLLKAKGIGELIEAAGLLARRGLDIEFLIVGDDAAPSRGIKSRLLRALGLGQNMKAEVLTEIERLGIKNDVHMLGFSARIAEAYGRMDVLCFPSHFDAPGRPIFEAAFAGVPSIVALRAPKPDTLVDGVTGLAVPPRDAIALADAIARLAQDREQAKTMGAAARVMAHRNFDPSSNSANLLELYRSVLAALPSEPKHSS
nr:glycosyltransferase family 4 protein [uncultured Devosia sp.]